MRKIYDSSGVEIPIGGGSTIDTSDIRQQLSMPTYNSSAVAQNAPLVLLHFSDIHSSSIELGRLMDMSINYPLNDILFTGDAIESTFDTFNMDYFNAIGGTNKILMSIGNHDTADSNGGGASSSPSTWTWNAHAGADAYARYFAHIADWGVTHDGNSSHCYYYKDYSTNKVRLVVLDCMAYDDAQNTWFSSVLNSVPSGYSVVVASHYAPSLNLVKANNSFDTDQAITSTGTALDSRAIALVNTFQSNGGSFVCWLCGHTHRDMFGYASSYPNQAIITIAEAKCYGTSYLYGDIKRVRNTPSQDLFNIVSIDSSAKTFTLLRVGAEWNKNLKHRFSLTWDYQNHRLIHD